MLLAPENSPILLDEVDCSTAKGEATSLFGCQAQWNHHNCNHGEDVVLECHPSDLIMRN